MVGRQSMIPLPHKSIALVELETDSLSTDEAKIKWVGIYSYLHDQYYEIPFKGNEKEIKKLIGEHKVIIGFNFKEYDAPILKNNYNDDQMFDYRILIDLLEISAPKGGKEYGKYNKNKLAQMGIKLKNFSLRAISDKLKLSDEGKGDVDYKIFQKDELTYE
jgi:hypothetical protein